MNTKHARLIMPGAHNPAIDPAFHHRYGAECENASLPKLAKYQAKESFAHSCHLLHIGFTYRLHISASHTSLGS